MRIHQRQKLVGFLTRVAEESGLAARFTDEAAAELRFVMVSRPRMARMNWQFLQHHGATDVLAFDLAGPAACRVPGEPLVVGEVYVCAEVAAAAAGKFANTPEDELLLYMVHGVLHLIGEDDHAPTGRRRMRRLEKRVIARALAGMTAAELLSVEGV